MTRRPSFVVIVKLHNGEVRAIGLYRSFRKASNDAKVWNGVYAEAYVLPIENAEELP
jgi:hypothetical protein